MSGRRRFKLMSSQHGAVAIEYALIAALIAAFLIGSIVALGSALQARFDAIADVTGGRGGL